MPAFTGIGLDTSCARMTATLMASIGSACLQLAALNLRAVTRWQQHERLRIACLGRLAGTRVGAFGTVVLRDRIDAVALFQFVLLHPHHVVLDGLRHLAHVLHLLRLSR